MRKYTYMDGFRYYCNSNHLRCLLYNTFGGKLLAKLPYNLIISGLIKDFYYSLLNNPAHSGPLTDQEDTQARGRYHPRGSPEEDKAIGFKLMYDQLKYYGFLKNFIKEEGISVIHLIRNNPLKIYLSRLTGRKRGVAHAIYEVKEVKVWVDPKKILNHLNLIMKNQERMKKFFSDNSYLEIASEDFFGNHSETSKKILDFLGVDEREIRAPKLKKLNPDSVRQIIENYDEIFEVIKGTSYERFLG
ncbi:MAG: hypothetical protein HYW01_00190 [Deltaproteobacteria bacterium]|nr:hypothetical protein [Deltaproteobacteria bacterium]